MIFRRLIFRSGSLSCFFPDIPCQDGERVWAGSISALKNPSLIIKKARPCEQPGEAYRSIIFVYLDSLRIHSTEVD